MVNRVCLPRACRHVAQVAEQLAAGPTQAFGPSSGFAARRGESLEQQMKHESASIVQMSGHETASQVSIQRQSGTELRRR